MTSAIIRGASAGTPTASARRGGLAPAIVAAVAAGLQGMAVAALLGGISTAKAENYPTRAIRLLVGFPAGGPGHPARAVAGKLAEALGTPVVVENKPGAGGLLATQDLLRQSPDGHTLLLCTYFDPVNTLLYRKARYKISDVAPISLIATYDYVLATANTVPADTVAQLIELTRANPDRFNYGHIGIASPANLIFKQLERQTGMEHRRRFHSRDLRRPYRRSSPDGWTFTSFRPSVPCNSMTPSRSRCLPRPVRSGCPHCPVYRH